MTLIRDTGQDLRYAARSLAKHPGFTAISVITLALGIGANTAIFTLVNAILLRPLPYHQPDRLVAIHEERPDPPLENATRRPPILNVVARRDQIQSFEGIMGFQLATYNLLESDTPEKLDVAMVTANFCDVLGVRPLLGRCLTAEEEEQASPAVVLSYGLFVRQFGADPDIVGRTLPLETSRSETQAFEVVGVLGPDFRFYYRNERFDLWTPISHYSAYRRPEVWIASYAVGRLKPAVGIAQAKAELETLQQGLYEPGEDRGWAHQFILRTLRDDVAHEVTDGLLVLAAAVGFVLLIACANLASLLLTRGMRRSKEVAIRAALGAGRARLIRQLLTESILLAGLGGAAAVLIAHWGVSGLLSIRFARVPRIDEVAVDPTVILFTALAAVLTGIFVGLIPALRASRVDPFRMLKEGGARTGADFRTTRLRGALVAGEIALCLILLAGAGLMIRLMIHLTTLDIGFDRNDLLVAQVTSPHGTRDTARDAAFFDEAVDKLRAVPGVRHAGLQQFTPLASVYMFDFIEPPGRPIERFEDLPHVNARTVSPGYFDTMGIPILSGRTFRRGEGLDGREVVVISESLAQQYFPGQNPVGQTLIRRARETREPAEIIGVAGDVALMGSFRDQRAILYKPYTQFTPSTLYAVVRTEGDPLAVAPAVRAALTSLNRTNAVGTLQTLDELWAQQVAEPRFYMLLLAAFAGLALLLAAVGLYGVISHSVAQRTHEIGVRLALGAERADVMRMVLRQGLRMTLLGVALGLAGSLALTRFLESLLQDVSPTDPLVLASVSVFLMVVALLAAYLPARRASRVDPMIALRYE